MSENQRVIFVKNLQRYMKLRGVDQADIVIALNVSASTVSDWVTGKKYPRVDSMQRLADFLGVLISDLNSGAGASAQLASPLEAELINIFRGLNGKGQDSLMRQARYLDSDPDMKKVSTSNSATTA